MQRHPVDVQHNYLPYQTTSQQAMETLAGGVGYGAPRHISSRRTKKIEKKKSSRFGFCQCGGNADLYDDGLNTSFVASFHPGERVIGRMRAGSYSQSGVPPLMPSVDFLPGRSQDLVMKRTRSETSSGEDGFKDIRIGVLPHIFQSTRTFQQSSPSVVRVNRPATQLDSINYSGSFSPESSDTKAQTTIDVDAKIIKTAFEDVKPAVAKEKTVSEKDGQNRVRDSQDQQKELKSDQSLSVEGYKNKRRGGFIALTSNEVPVKITVPSLKEMLSESPSSGALTSPLDTIGSRIQIAKSSSRSSLASSISKYSASSPYLESHSIPSRATMGGPTGERKSASSLGQQQDNGTTYPSTMVQSRGSMTSNHQSLSIMSSPSITESFDQSPAIGEVLSHFPSLTGMNQTSTSSSQATSDDYETDYDDDDLLSSRINTFGPSRRRCDDQSDSPARINSFHYDEKLTFQLQRRQLSFSTPNASSPSSTPSSVDSYSTVSSSQSRRSHKRTAVLCGLPSQSSLAALRLRSETEGDLTWQERLLSFSNEGEEQSCEEEGDDGERVKDITLVLGSVFPASGKEGVGNVSFESSASHQTIQCQVNYYENRSRNSSSNTASQAPFSPPPDLPLPPVPPPSTTKRKGGHVRSSNSFINTDRPTYHYRSTATSLPRSVTCPDLTEEDYAF